jgi:hypothetical protein
VPRSAEVSEVFGAVGSSSEVYRLASLFLFFPRTLKLSPEHDSKRLRLGWDVKPSSSRSDASRDPSEVGRKTVLVFDLTLKEITSGRDVKLARIEAFVTGRFNIYLEPSVYRILLALDPVVVH